MISALNLGTRLGTLFEGNLGTKLGTPEKPLKIKAGTPRDRNHSQPGTTRPPLGGRGPQARSETTQ